MLLVLELCKPVFSFVEAYDKAQYEKVLKFRICHCPLNFQFREKSHKLKLQIDKIQNSKTG